MELSVNSGISFGANLNAKLLAVIVEFAKTISVHGLVMNSKTGLLDLLSDGNAYAEQPNKG